MVDKWGGKRKGAGRPFKTGKYGEKTTPIRIPSSILPAVLRLMKSLLKLNHSGRLEEWLENIENSIE